MKKNLFFLLLACSLSTVAQKRYRPNKKLFPETIPYSYQTAITFSPLALAQIDFTFFGGIEQRLNKRIILTGEAGYIFASNYLSNGNSDFPGQGFILRPSLKWLLSDGNKFYLQPQLFYKQVSHRVEDWLGKEAVNDVSSYEQYQKFKYRRIIYGGNIIWGWLAPLDRNDKAFLDLYLGLGLRKKEAKVVGEPHSIYRRNRGIIINDDTLMPSLPVGVRLLLTLKKSSSEN